MKPSNHLSHPRIIAFLTLLFLFAAPSVVQAQHDSIVLKNGDIIVGEIKSMDKGTLVIETDYSDKDFTIEWSGVKEIFCKTRFLITLQNGDRINGTLISKDSGKTLEIIGVKNQKDSAYYQVQTTLGQVVYLKGLKSDFWSRAYASIDLGLNLTRANNLRQWNSNLKMGYLADKWLLDFYYSGLLSKQDSIASTKRTETGASFNYYLPRDWYAAASLTFLSNTEQALDLRTTGKLGMGKYLIHTNSKYWGLAGGISFNNETFSNETAARSSLEGYVGSELNLFDIGDFSLFNSLYVYPSFTEAGRWRSDLKLDTKYEFLEDFYVKLNLTVNYDNQPAIKGKETDYVFGFSIGWEL